MKDNDIPMVNNLCQKVSLHQLLAGSFIFVMIWINIDLAFQILPNGQNYAAGKWVVFILGLSRLFISTFGVGTSVLGYSRYYYMSLIFTVFLTTSAILLNIYLIPILGINGSALSNLISYVLYISMLLVLIRWKIGTNPLSWAQLKVVVIISTIFIINILWIKTLYPIFTSLPFKPVINNIIDGIIKTVLLGGLGIATIYFWRVSEEVNGLARKAMAKLHR